MGERWPINELHRAEKLKQGGRTWPQVADILDRDPKGLPVQIHYLHCGRKSGKAERWDAERQYLENAARAGKPVVYIARRIATVRGEQYTEKLRASVEVRLIKLGLTRKKRDELTQGEGGKNSCTERNARRKLQRAYKKMKNPQLTSEEW